MLRDTLSFRYFGPLSCKKLLHFVGGVALEGGDDVGIGVQGEADLAMAKGLHDCPRVAALA